MAIAYWTVAGITFSIILRAFLRDRDTRKVSVRAWVFIGTATLLWPITLPFIINSKRRAAKFRQHSSAADTSKASHRALETESSAALTL